MSRSATAARSDGSVALVCTRSCRNSFERARHPKRQAQRELADHARSEEAKDVSNARTERETNADLMRALRYRVGDDGIEPNSGQDERDSGE